MSKLSNKWWNQPTFSWKTGEDVIYVKVWSLLVVAFLLGMLIG